MRNLIIYLCIVLGINAVANDIKVGSKVFIPTYIESLPSSPELEKLYAKKSRFIAQAQRVRRLLGNSRYNQYKVRRSLEYASAVIDSINYNIENNYLNEVVSLKDGEVFDVESDSVCIEFNEANSEGNYEQCKVDKNKLYTVSSMQRVLDSVSLQTAKIIGIKDDRACVKYDAGTSTMADKTFCNMMIERFLSFSDFASRKVSVGDYIIQFSTARKGVVFRKSLKSKDLCVDFSPFKGKSVKECNIKITDLGRL